MSEIIYVKPIPHSCNLRADLSDEKRTVGSIARCSCGRFFRCVLRDEFMWVSLDWSPVRWWNFKERKLIRQYLADVDKVWTEVDTIMPLTLSKPSDTENGDT